MYGFEGVEFSMFSAVSCDAIPVLGLNQVVEKGLGTSPSEQMVHACIGNFVATFL